MAVFGKTDNGASTTVASADRKTVSQATPSTSGIVTSLTARLNTNNAAGATVFRGVIYADNAGAPGALLAVGDEVAINGTTETAYTSDFSGANQISIVGSTPYWIGVIIQDPGSVSWVISRDNTSSMAQVNADTYSDGPTDPFGTPTAQNGPIDVFVTYSEGTSVNSERAVKLVGEASVNSERAVKLTGEATMSSERGVKLTGIADVGGSLDLQVAASGDDNYQETNGNANHITSTSLRLDTNTRHVALHFRGAGGIQGETIDTAMLGLHGFSGSNLVIDAEVYAEDVDDPADLTSGSDDISDRVLTTAHETFSTTLSSSGFTELDIASVVQEIADRVSLGDEIMIILTWNSGTTDISAYDKDSAEAATLSITFAGGTPVSDERAVKLTGEASVNSERSAKLFGVIDIESERSAKLTGEASTNSERAVKLSGQGNLSVDLVEITFSPFTPMNDERAVKLTGKAQANDERNVKLIGGIDVDDERSAKLSGKDTASSERNAKLTGQDTTSSERLVKLVGEDAVSDERGVKLAGEAPLSSERGVKLTGVAAAGSIEDERSVKLTGEDTASSQRNVKLSGEDSANDERAVKLSGEDTLGDQRNVKLIGEDTFNDQRAVKLVGGVNVDSERNIKLIGEAELSSERGISLRGEDTTESERAVKLTGGINISSERGVKLTGKPSGALPLPPISVSARNKNKLSFSSVVRENKIQISTKLV